MVPWSATVVVRTSYEKVSIYLGGEKHTISVSEKDDYIVYLLNGIVPNQDYVIVPASVQMDEHSYTKQFGPDNYKACSEWLLAHSKTSQAFVSGGGSDAPRGTLIF